MRLLKHLWSSSIGKKQVVAATGLLLIGFLLSHLAGNLLLLKGPAAFDHYAEFLEHHPLILPAEIGLLVLFLSHIFMAGRVTLENWWARPEPYAGKVSEGGSSWGSSTMKYTGLIVLIFLLYHVWSFKYNHPRGGSLAGWVMENFFKPWYAAFYLFAMMCLGLHLSHGVKSAFQTFGVSHRKYTPAINCLGILLALALMAGFGMLPMWGFSQGG